MHLPSGKAGNNILACTETKIRQKQNSILLKPLIVCDRK